MKAKVDAIAAHGITCFVNRQLIYNYPESLLAERGIMVIEHADFEGVERLSLVTGGEITSTFDRPDLVKLGHCELIEEIMIGEDTVRTAQFAHHYKLFSNSLSIAHQVLWCRRRRGLHGRPPRINKPDGRRGRTLPARRPLRAVANSQGDEDGPWRRML